MADHDPIHRQTCAEYLRGLAKRVESGAVEGVWVVVTPAGKDPINSHLSLLGPSHDKIALARLMFEDELLRQKIRDVVLNDSLFGSWGTDRKTGPCDGEDVKIPGPFECIHPPR